MQAIMKNTHTVIPFPAHRARPPLFRLAQTLSEAARSDSTLSLWDSLPTGDGNRIECADLCSSLPNGDEGRAPATLASMVADFSILGLFAIQTGQWMRPDLLGDLMELQARAEHLRVATGGAVAQRA